MIFRYMIYGLVGWCMEVFWTGLGSLLQGNIALRGQTSLWMFPIYGLAIFLEPVYETIQQYSFVIRGITYMLLIFSVEYLTGWFLNQAGLYIWDYTGTPFSVHGIIRLDYAPVWFIVGLIFEKLYLLLKDFTPLTLF